MDLGDAAAERGVLLHLRDHVGQEEHLPVTRPGDEAELGIAVVVDDEARVDNLLLAAHTLLVGGPALAVRRVGEHEVECLALVGVVRQRRVLRPADEAVGVGALALEEEVGDGDRVGLAVDLLPEEVGDDPLPVLPGDVLRGLLGDGEHAAGAHGSVVEGVRASGELVRNGVEDEPGHQAHRIARCPVLASLLVVRLVEAAHELFEDGAHCVVVEALGAQVNGRVEKLLDQRTERVGPGQLGDLLAHLKVLDDVLHVGAEPIEVRLEVLLQAGLGRPASQLA